MRSTDGCAWIERACTSYCRNMLSGCVIKTGDHAYGVQKLYFTSKVARASTSEHDLGE